MSVTSRIAVGTIQPEADLGIILCALLETLRREGFQVQTFLSRADFSGYWASADVTGLNPRQLDSWLMPSAICQEIFAHGSESADIALVQGTFSKRPKDVGGDLATLCQWLDLSRLVVLDASRLDRCISLPRPEHLDGVLLDRVEDEEHLAWLSTNLEALWGVPILGALERLPELRAAIEGVPAGIHVPRDLYFELGNHFARYWQPQYLKWLLRRAPLAEVPPRLYVDELETSDLTVAVAFDEAFNCYFAETFDLLEMRGAKVHDFSPLRDEQLPLNTDVVYLGCGHPEHHASTLSENHCMKSALRNHVSKGGRIFAEGGGLAYLCQHLKTPDGALSRMAGLLPAVARLGGEPYHPVPTEVTLERTNWLARSGDSVRGYRNNTWELEPVGALNRFTGDGTTPWDLVGSFLVVGSLLHLNLAVQPGLLDRFFRPHLAHPHAHSDPWAPVS